MVSGGAFRGGTVSCPGLSAEEVIERAGLELLDSIDVALSFEVEFGLPEAVVGFDT